MSEAQSNLFNQQMSEAADATVAKVAGVMKRPLSEVERQIALSLFWTRASTTQGDWIDLVQDGAAPRIGVTPAFERCYLALAARVLNGGALVASVASASPA